MKTLYQAANSLEAHMIVHMLEQQGIKGRVDGEYLQGGVGELPAAGLVRVVVPEEDYTAAKAIVDRWDASQPASQPHAAPVKAAGRLSAFLLGAVLGGGAIFALYHAPIARDGIDHNRDGKVNDKWVYSATGRVLKNEVDRNNDGKVDYVARFGTDGAIYKLEQDDDFDGVFETVTAYRFGNPHVSETDTDNDGYRDLRTNFVNGVLDSVEYIYPATGYPQRIEYLKLGKITHAEIDVDKDGKMDKRLRYNDIGEVIFTENIQ